MTKVKLTSPRHLYVDLCFTIVKENTTYTFIKYVIKSEGTTLHKFLYTLYMSKFFSIWQRIIRSQNYNRTTLLLNLIAGFKKDILEAHAMQYAKRALSFNARDEVIKMINDAKNRQDDVTILSASIDPVVKAFSDILSVDYRCSTLEYNNNLATGALNFDMSGLKSLHVTNSTHTTMITDNFEDIEMQSKISEFYIVLNHPSHKKFWQVINNVKGFIS